MSTRLTIELRLLFAVERDTGLPAAPVIRQLVAWEDACLPDSLPPPPTWTTFHWPAGGTVDLTAHWRAQDGGKERKWAGPYL